ncbi:MAG: M23 family metallopeptidase [Spirochaetaceae bacterium]|nr:M23 family metallopeptidase [Spirochaetaceae bacterium]
MPGPLDEGGQGAVQSRAEARILDLLFMPPFLSTLAPDSAADMAVDYLRAARAGGQDLRKSVADAFPPPVYVLSLLALDRDVESFLESASEDSPAGGHYHLAASLAEQMRPLRSRYEALYAAAYAELSGSATVVRAPAAQAPPFVASPGKLWLPRERKLSGTHPYALDLFFNNFENVGGEHIGPPIFSLGDGLVVAASGDWRGGAGSAAWIDGGLSPAAGNGVVVYEPASRRYCSYFHLSSVAVKAGDIVHAGQTLGLGGNSGANARKKNHGGHLHVEIFDAALDSPLSSRKLLALLKGS